MQQMLDGYNDVIRLEKGERLSEALERFTADSQLTVIGAWLSGIGGARDITLGFFNVATKSYSWKTFADVHEIVSLQGNLAAGPDGKMMFHLHGAFSSLTYQTVGGHVKDFVAAATVELFVHRTYKPLTRTMDDEVGLPLLNLS